MIQNRSYIVHKFFSYGGSFTLFLSVKILLVLNFPVSDLIFKILMISGHSFNMCGEVPFFHIINV